MKLHVVTFGCQMSAADGEELSRPLASRGFAASETLEDADAVLVNTCTVRQHAEDRAVSLIGRLKAWKDERPERFVIVAGCAAERLGGQLQARFPHVDLVVGARSIEDYPRLLDEALRARFDWAADNAGAWSAPQAPLAVGGSCQYLTIMRGCNYSCSYCIVPAVRGRELYRPMRLVLEEARARVADGARELMLLGQTVNSYRPPDGGDFADLLRSLDAVDGLERIRFMSPHPYYVNDRMIEAVAASPKVCRHLHLPVQSGSDRILRAMRRNYTAAGYLATVERLRAALPGLAVTTDVIAGFPGETEEDFRATLALVVRLDPVSAYCFKFSPRDGTEAASLPEPVPEPARDERLGRLLALVEAGMRRHLEALIGSEVRVLLEDDRHGRTEKHFKARLERPGRPGTTVTGTVTGATRTALKVKPAA